MKKDELTLMMQEYPSMPLRDVVFRTLRKEILQGSLRAGERLVEINLANRLGVSRTPVRDALEMLEAEGLVIRLPRRGAIVSEITRKNLNDVLEVRIGLEMFAASLACERIKPSAIVALKAAAEKFAAAIWTDDISEMANTDKDFHDLIYHAANNDTLLQLLNNMQEQMYRYRMEYLKDEKIRQELAKEHLAIIKSLEDRDVEMAKIVAQEHVQQQRDYILKLISEDCK